MRSDVTTDMLGDTAVSASSSTQHCVILSKSEAEYVAMAHGAKAALAIKSVLDFVQPQLSSSAISMFEDNAGAKALAENPRVPTAASTLTYASTSCGGL